MIKVQTSGMMIVDSGEEYRGGVRGGNCHLPWQAECRILPEDLQIIVSEDRYWIIDFVSISADDNIRRQYWIEP